MVHSVEMKGYDQFTATRYADHALQMRSLFEKAGHKFTHVPCHKVHMEFPTNLEALGQFDAVLLSDVGANTMLLHPDTTRFCKRTTNLLKLIKDYVEYGGGFGMIGGYLTFQGFEAKGQYKDTPIEDILPVNLLANDDRIEIPEGADLYIDPDAHPLLHGLPATWPYILGYNRVLPKEGAQILVANAQDPIIAVGFYGKGRTMAYATDCMPHWAPPAMTEWEYYDVLWDRLVRWLADEL